MKIDQILEYRDMCNVCGQTPCNCTHVAESQLNEFAPGSGDDREPDEEEILRQLASRWWLGTEQQMAQAQKTLDAMGWEIGPVESGDDDAGVFLIRPGDENGDTYISFNHSELSLDEGIAEGAKSHSELARLAHEAYIAAVRQGNALMANHYKQAYEKHKRLAASERKSIAKGMAEGASNIGSAIKSLYQKIYAAGDDEIEYFYHDSPIFAQYWDEYEGDLDSIIAEVDPSELEVIKAELESYVDDANLAEGDVTRTPTGLIHRAKDKYGAGEEPFSPVNPGKYARDLDHVNKQQVKDLDASMGITWKNRGTKGVEVDESKPKEKEADYGPDYQDMVARVKKLAGLGPLKTVYDPQKRVYRNMPTAVQPKK